jgi:hypothetical protein
VKLDRLFANRKAFANLRVGKSFNAAKRDLCFPATQHPVFSNPRYCSVKSMIAIAGVRPEDVRFQGCPTRFLAS